MKRLIAVCAALLLGGTALAQGLPNLFDVGLGVRAMGYGGAYLALAEGSEALLYNPAGLAWLGRASADSSYTGSMGLVSVGWLAGAIPGFGVGAGYLGVGGITDPEGSPLNFGQFGLVGGAGLDGRRPPLSALPVPVPYAAGIALKFMSATVADASAVGVALDIGVLTRMSSPLGELRAGLVIRDLGFGLAVGETRDGWTTDIAIGAALLNPMGFIATVDLGTGYVALGVGWRAVPAMEVRGGLQLQGGALRWALGAGFSWEAFQIDYALQTHPFLGTSHRLAFGVDLSALLGW